MPQWPEPPSEQLSRVGVWSADARDGVLDFGRLLAVAPSGPH